jgi:adenylate cyclase
MTEASSLRLLVLNKRQSLEIPFTQQITIGRDVVNTLPLIDDEASRSHAILYAEDALDSDDSKPQLTIKDLNSMNGVYVNGKRIKESPLGPGDEVVLGATILVISPNPNTDLEDCLSSRGRSILKHIRSPKPFKPAAITSFSMPELREMAEREFDNYSNTAIWLPKTAAIIIKAIDAMVDAKTEGDFHNAALQAARPLVSADRGVIMTQDGDGKTLGIRGLFSERADQTLTINQNVMRILMTGDKAIYSPDVAADDRMPDFKDPPAEHDPHTLLAVPIECGGKAAGFLYLDSLNRSYSFNESALVLAYLLLRPYARIAELRGFFPKT